MLGRIVGKWEGEEVLGELLGLVDGNWDGCIVGDTDGAL